MTVVRDNITQLVKLGCIVQIEGTQGRNNRYEVNVWASLLSEKEILVIKVAGVECVGFRVKSAVKDFACPELI